MKESYDYYDANAQIDDGTCACTGDEVVLQLLDSFGDGWGGSFITIDNTDYTISGSTATFDICIRECNEILMTALNWFVEISWDITNITTGTEITSGDQYSISAGVNNMGYIGPDCVMGCTIKGYDNYDDTAPALIDDGTCACVNGQQSTFELTGTTARWQGIYAWNYGAKITINDNIFSGIGSYSTCVQPGGCHDVVFTLGYSSSYGILSEWNLSPSITYLPTRFSRASGNVGKFGQDCVMGCTKGGYDNYDANAQIDDGSCACAQPATLELDSTYNWYWAYGASITIGGKEYRELGTHEVCLNYCTICSVGCMEVVFNAGTLYNTYLQWTITDNDGIEITSGTGEDNTFTEYIGNGCASGCTKEGYDNYDANAVIDDGSCDCTGGEITLNLDDSFGDGWNGAKFTINGVDYTIDSGDTATFTMCDICTVVFTPGSWDSEISWNITGTGVSESVSESGYGTDTTIEHVSTGCVEGCMNEDYANYDEFAQMDNDSCECAEGETEVTLELHGSGTNVWNFGATITIDGNIFSGISYGVGSYDMCLSGCQDVVFNKGIWFNELISWDITDENGTVTTTGRGSDTYGVTEQVGYNGPGCVVGCTKEGYDNYNTSAPAQMDDGSCACEYGETKVTLHGTSWDAWTVGATITIDGNIFRGIGSYDMCLSGCQDVVFTAGPHSNYRCSWDITDITDNGESTTSGTGDASGTVGYVGADCVRGCMNEEGGYANYDADAQIDNGICACTGVETEVTLELYGTSLLAWNYGATIAIDDNTFSGIGSYGMCLSGCQDVNFTAGSYLNHRCSWDITDENGTVTTSGTGNDVDERVDYVGADCVRGCMNEEGGYDNYDADAQIDDDSCACAIVDTEVTLELTDSFGDGWNGGFLTINGVDYTVSGSTATFNMCPSGCMEVIFTAGSWAYECSWNITDNSGTEITSLGYVGECVFGCTDPTATNYNAAATADDGSCTFPCADTQLTLNLYDSWGDGWNDGFLTINSMNYTILLTYPSPNSNTATFIICIDLVVCTDVIYTAGSWAYENSWEILNSDALIASGGDASGTVGCVFGCTDATATNYDATATDDDGSCTYTGCTDPAATNYDANANVDNGCEYSCDVGTSLTLNLDDSYGDGWNGGFLTINGVNYTIPLTSPYPNSDTATFNICTSGCQEVVFTAGSYASECSWVITDENGTEITTGIGTGTTVDSVGPDCGCTDPTATNYDVTATVDVGGCEYINGCMDATATNYNAAATADDGSCCAADTPLTLNLYDSYGDGWNGGSLTINGTPYTQSDDDYSSPYTANTAESFYICIDLTVCTDVIYAAGSYSAENSWDVTNSSML